MFKYSAFTENTSEIKRWAKDMGFIEHGNFRNHNEYLTVFTATDNELRYYSSVYEHELDLFYSDFIDCRNNPELFKAVTAIRDDSDCRQWFIFDNDVYDMDDVLEVGNTLLFKRDEWYLCTEYTMPSTKAHKASLQELQEHFKK